ncbi:PilZ domain-containing protein [Nannocystis pusilla]|uniref:PilZ domain-containing protein n=1 Tax=Nannocystis pusilla TaxID=889268 RepID=A0ABS7TXP7_9BACT|nr:PilZ domain-containing protein [Nannocystis pusilla]
MTAARPANDRFVCDLAVELDTGRARIPGRIRDITEAGLCCVIGDPVGAGITVTAHLRLVFEWGMSEPLPLLGQVLWLTPTEGRYQVGVAFSQPTPDVWQRFDVLLKILFGQINLPTPAAG